MERKGKARSRLRNDMAAKKAKTQTTAEKLDAIGIDAICEKLLGGEYLTGIAQQNRMSVQSITSWIASDPERSARAREARVASASHWDCRAEQVLLDADEMVPGAITKARELASHYRWRASKYAPREYGEKVTQEVTGKDGGPQEHVVSVRPQISREEWIKEHGLNK